MEKDYVPINVRKRLRMMMISQNAKEKKLLEKAEKKRKALDEKLYFYAALDKMRQVDEMTVQEIGDSVGLTRERVRQILEQIQTPKKKSNASGEAAPKELKE